MSDYVIPGDCWPDILKRLPVKSLARFRRVCRLWNAFISSSFFIADHLASSRAKTRLFIDGVYQPPSNEKSCVIYDSDSHAEDAATFVPPVITSPFPELELHCYDLVGSAKGIICFLVRRCSSISQKRVILLWNPVINKYIKLPDPDTKTCCGFLCHDMLMAVGVKPSEDDLRVLTLTGVLFVLDGLMLLLAEIYSVRQRAWRVLQTAIPSCDIFVDHDSIDSFFDCSEVQSYLNGIVHWVATKNRHLFILRFDFEEEEFSTMALPEIVAESKRRNVHAAVYCEKLAVLEIGVGEESYCNIWTMGEYGNVDSWSVVIHIETSGKDNFVHGITSDGQIVLSVGDDNDLLLYDSTKGAYRRLGMQAVEKRFSGCEFVESLVFMDGEGGARGVSSVPLDLH